MSNEEQLAKRQYLLTGLLDGELTAAEAAEANELLIRDQDFRTEFEAQRRTGDLIAELDFALPHERDLDALWRNPYRRWSYGLGFLLVGGGCLALLLFGFWQLLSRGTWDLPTIATLSIWLGLLVLFGSALLQRLKSRQSDPYQEIQR